MIIAWRGRGLLVLATIGAGFGLTQLCVDWVFGDSRYYSSHSWSQILGGGIAATLTHFLAKWLAWLRTKKADANLKPGGPIDVTELDAFFWIPAKEWPWIIVALSILIVLVK